MFDSNKNQQNILFKKEFDDWTSLNENIKIVYTLMMITPMGTTIPTQRNGMEKKAE